MGEYDLYNSAMDSGDYIEHYPLGWVSKNHNYVDVVIKNGKKYYKYAKDTAANGVRAVQNFGKAENYQTTNPRKDSLSDQMLDSNLASKKGTVVKTPFGKTKVYGNGYQDRMDAVKKSIKEHQKKKDYMGLAKDAINFAREYDKEYRSWGDNQAMQDRVHRNTDYQMNKAIKGDNLGARAVRVVANAYVDSAEQREQIQNAINAAKKQLADTPVIQLVNQGSDLVKQGVGILLGFFSHDGFDEEFVTFDEIEKGDEILHSIL